jgi:4a-hydroxytetrahydrobiopterin dehydratase
MSTKGSCHDRWYCSENLYALPRRRCAANAGGSRGLSVPDPWLGTRGGAPATPQIQICGLPSIARIHRQSCPIGGKEGHHPDICFGWGYAAVSLQTHKIKGLHENDFIMAAKINLLAGS